MSDKSNFLIEVSGEPVDDSAVERFSRLIHRILMKEDLNVRLATVNFARLFYKLSWSGLPKDMYYISMAHKKILEEMGKYFKREAYKTEINLIVREEGI